MRRMLYGLYTVLLVLLLLTTGCSNTGNASKETGEGTPRPSIYVRDTIYMDTGDAEKVLPEDWEALGPIKYVLADREIFDENCENYTANCTSGEIGDILYGNEEVPEKIYMKSEINGTYVPYTKCYKPMIYVQDTLYISEDGYFLCKAEQSLPEGWKSIGTIQQVVFQDRLMVMENFTGNDSAFMAEGDGVYSNGEVPDKIYLKCGSNEYIPFVKCKEY